MQSEDRTIFEQVEVRCHLDARLSAASGGFTLLIEFVVRTDHPLNADRLHSILKGMNLVERDATWTREISSEEQGGNCSRLIRWCSDTDKRRVDPEVLRFRICDRSGNAVALYLEVGEQNCGFIVRTDELRAVLRELDLEILTIVVGERNAWADDGDFRGTYRRFNGLMTGIANFKSIKTWNEDNDPRTGS